MTNNDLIKDKTYDLNILRGNKIAGFQIAKSKEFIRFDMQDGEQYFFDTFADWRDSINRQFGTIRESADFKLIISSVSAINFNRDKAITDIYQADTSLLIQFNYGLTFNFKLFSKQVDISNLCFSEIKYGLKRIPVSE